MTRLTVRRAPGGLSGTDVRLNGRPLENLERLELVIGRSFTAAHLTILVDELDADIRAMDGVTVQPAVMIDGSGMQASEDDDEAN